MLVPWTPLSLSRRERAVRWMAMALAMTAAAALLVAAFRTDPFDRAASIAALFAIMGGISACLTTRRDSFEVGVDRAGTLAVRRCGDPDALPEQGLRCVFAAPWLITLKRGTMCIPVWPDSLPGNTFRRLWVYIRWSSGRRPADLPGDLSARPTE